MCTTCELAYYTWQVHKKRKIDGGGEGGDETTLDVSDVHVYCHFKREHNKEAVMLHVDNNTDGDVGCRRSDGKT